MRKAGGSRIGKGVCGKDVKDEKKRKEMIPMNCYSRTATAKSKGVTPFGGTQGQLPTLGRTRESIEEKPSI